MLHRKRFCRRFLVHRCSWEFHTQVPSTCGVRATDLGCFGIHLGALADLGWNQGRNMEELGNHEASWSHLTSCQITTNLDLDCLILHLRLGLYLRRAFPWLTGLPRAFGVWPGLWDFEPGREMTRWSKSRDRLVRESHQLLLRLDCDARSVECVRSFAQ